MSRPFRIVALVGARDDEDVIAQGLRALTLEGVKVYLLHQHSTGRMIAEAEALRGHGVVGIEQLPTDADRDQPDGDVAYERILMRKEAVVRDLDADWFIHADADEFYESPWPGQTLSDGIQRVDSLGYNAIDFQAFTFVPTTNDQDASDVRERLRYYDPAWTVHRELIRCWKNTHRPVVLTASAGSSAQFDDRRVFPIRFILRRYPIRSHAPRDRAESPAPRRAEAPGRTQNWRVYDVDLGKGMPFVRDSAGLPRWDPEGARWDLWLRHSDVDELQRLAAASAEEAKHLMIARAGLQSDLEDLRSRLAERDAIVQQLMTSRSWKLTAPLRAIDRLLKGR